MSNEVIDFNVFDSNPTFEPLSKKRSFSVAHPKTSKPVVIEIEEEPDLEEEKKEERKEKVIVVEETKTTQEEDDGLPPLPMARSHDKPPVHKRRFGTPDLPVPTERLNKRFPVNKEPVPIPVRVEPVVVDLTADYPYPYQPSLLPTTNSAKFHSMYEKAMYRFLVSLSQAIPHVADVQAIFHFENYMKVKQWETQREKFKPRLPDKDYYYSDFFEDVVFLNHLLVVRFALQRALSVLHFLPLCNQASIALLGPTRLERASSARIMDFMLNVEMGTYLIQLTQSLYLDQQIDTGAKYKNKEDLVRIHGEQAAVLLWCARNVHPQATVDEVDTSLEVEVAFAPLYNVVFPDWGTQILTKEEQAYCHAAFGFVSLFQQAFGRIACGTDFSRMQKTTDFITSCVGGMAATAIMRTLAEVKNVLHWKRLSLQEVWKRLILDRYLCVVLVDVCAAYATHSKLLQGNLSISPVVKQRTEAKLKSQMLLLRQHAS